MNDLDRIGASFISHNHKYLSDLQNFVPQLFELPILCWTIKSSKSEKKAREIATNITFEGYLA